MSTAVRPCDNPFNAQHIDALGYIEFEFALAEVADRLKRHGYRGAICGPHGCGKSALLRALGGQLMEHGFTPLPLFINTDQRGTLPADWARTIRRARPTDALLLDGYDILPRWARLWVIARSSRAGAVVVTTHQRAHFTTIARPSATPALLGVLLHRLAPTADGSIDCDRLFRDAHGNLRNALRGAYDVYAESHG